MSRFLIALAVGGLGAVSWSARAELKTTPVDVQPIELGGSAVESIGDLRSSIAGLEAQLTQLNGATEQGPPSTTFSEQIARQERERQIAQTRDNLVRLKKELSEAELRAAFSQHMPTLVDTVLANLSSGKNLEDKFRLELPSCVHLSKDNQDRLDALNLTISTVENEAAPFEATLRDSSAAVREHFKKLRAAADPNLLRTQHQLQPAKRTKPQDWAALMAKENELKDQFEKALTDVVAKQSALHKTLRFRDEIVKGYAKNFPQTSGCDPTPFRAKASKRQDEQAVWKTMGHDPIPYEAVDFDRGFFYIKATEAYGLDHDPAALPASSAGSAGIK